MVRVAVTGATGAMGTAVLDTAGRRDGVEAVLCVTRSPSNLDTSTPVVTPEELAEALATHNVDVIVDFTVPTASLGFAEAAAEHGVGIVIGTTGFGSSERAGVQAASGHAPVLLAPNFSRGVQGLLAALAAAIDTLPDYDIEVTETHHNRKRDAPSGTAETLLETIETARPATERVHGRSGMQPRTRDEVGVHARRAGTITGEHEVLIAGGGEELRLVHRAESRQVFAEGAIDAAVWLAEKSPGWYRFEDVLGT